MLKEPTLLYSAEEAAGGGVDTEAPPAQTEAVEEERHVPLAVHTKVRKEKAQLEQRLAEIENAKVEEAKARMSEVDRMRHELEESRREIEARDKKIMYRDRAGLIRAAALKAKFADPDDAVAFADLEEIEDRHAAERVVSSLAKRKPHLLAGDPTPNDLRKVTNGGLSGDDRQHDPARTEYEARLQEGEAIRLAIEDARAGRT